MFVRDDKHVKHVTLIHIWLVPRGVGGRLKFPLYILTIIVYL